MKTIYKYSLVLGLVLVSANMIAQRDSLLTRQVMLEREYNPTLNEATKINTSPNIYTPKTQNKNVMFLDKAPQLNIPATKIGNVASGDIRTDVPFSKQRFYLDFAAGTLGNLDGAIGGRVLDMANDKLDISATHISANGNVNYEHKTPLIKKAKGKYADTNIKLKYQHTFTPAILSFDAGFMNNGYNYYGTPFSELIPIAAYDFNKKQKVNVFNFGAGFKSKDEGDKQLIYDANISYSSYKQDVEFMPVAKGAKANIFKADLDLATRLGDGYVGGKADLVLQSSTNKNKGVYSGYYDKHTAITFSPYYKLEGLNWNIHAGANIAHVSDSINKFLITPEIKAQIHFNEVNTLYVTLTGGVNSNTYLDVLQENRYATALGRTMYSRTIYDGQLGFKSSVLTGLEFDVFGGYKKTRKDHVYQAYSFVEDNSSNLYWSNIGSPIYTNISTGHMGVQVNTNLIPYTTLSGKFVAFFYNVSYLEKAYERPKYTFDLSADIKPIDNLIVSLNYLLAGGRKGLNTIVHKDMAGAITAATNVRSMKAINEFNIRGEYQLTEWLSVNARINNLLNQKYERHLGYTQQGVNFMGGVNLKF